MFRCGKILMTLALMLTMPITATAQTADKPAAPSTRGTARKSASAERPNS